MKSVATFLMFTGQAEEAVTFYTSLFEDAVILSLKRHEEGGFGTPGTVQHMSFSLNGQQFMAIDSPPVHEFTFTPSISIFVTCADAMEVERLFTALADGGSVLMPLAEYPFSAKYGWLNDRFGVSWQVSLAV